MNYFTDGEFWETLRGSTKKYRFDEKRLIRQYTYSCSGATYDGEWKGGFRDGKGTMRWSDGASYEGQWSDNHASGTGIFKHKSGDVYEGDWKRDRANG